MPPVVRPSLAKDLFDWIIKGDSIAILRAMVEGENKATENGWLEFKAYPWDDFTDPLNGCQPKNLKDRKRDFIKETWSQVLSAFANTQGGVLIWGIHAAKNQDGIDCAEKLVLVPSPKALSSRLTELQHQATDPPVPGVQVLPFEDPSESGKGFVVCFVPESPYSPHRAEYSNRNYYMRFGDSTDIPPVSVLRRLFFPQTNSALHATAELTYSQAGSAFDPTFTINCSVTLENRGYGTARSVYIGIDHKFDESNVMIHMNGLGVATSSYGHARTMALGEILHPGFKTQLFSLTALNARKRKKDVGNGAIHLVPQMNGLTFRIRIFQDNSEPMDLEVAFDQDDFDFNRRSCVKDFTLS